MYFRAYIILYRQSNTILYEKAVILKVVLLSEKSTQQVQLRILVGVTHALTVPLIISSWQVSPNVSNRRSILTQFSHHFPCLRSVKFYDVEILLREPFLSELMRKVAKLRLLLLKIKQIPFIERKVTLKWRTLTGSRQGI